MQKSLSTDILTILIEFYIYSKSKVFLYFQKISVRVFLTLSDFIIFILKEKLVLRSKDLMSKNYCIKSQYTSSSCNSSGQSPTRQPLIVVSQM